MKILLISPLPPPYGGIANWSKLLLEFAKNTEDEFLNLNIAPKKRSTEGRGIFDRVVVSGFDMLKKKSELKRNIKTFKPDVIHLTTSGSLSVIRDYLMLKTAKSLGVPTVYHLHFGKAEELLCAGSFLSRLFAKAITLANTVIAIDNKTFTALKRHIPSASFSLLPNPINLKALPEIADEREKRIVFIGWVVPEKGVSELVSAWNTVGKEYPDYELTVIGQARPDYLKELKELATIDNITFTGELPHNEAMEILAKSSIFVLPSYTEGCPYSVIEAMALKNTVIATNVGAIPEMLNNDCGIAIEPKSTAEVAEALRNALSDKDSAENLAENACTKAWANYSAEVIYSKYKEIWGRL